MLRRLARASKYSHHLRFLAPFTAVSLATFVNMGLMRRTEIADGVMIEDDFGDAMGRSKEAGKVGVGISIAGRILTACAPMTIPTLVSDKANKTFLRKLPKVRNEGGRINADIAASAASTKSSYSSFSSPRN